MSLDKIFCGYYVTPEGELYSLKTGERKYTWMNRGRAALYERVQFWVDGKKKNYYVHRIVAMLYLDDWDDELEVDHLDGNTLNNHYLNLGMKTTTDNQLAYQDRKDTIKPVYLRIRGSKCVMKFGYRIIYQPMAI